MFIRTNVKPRITMKIRDTLQTRERQFDDRGAILLGRTTFKNKWCNIMELVILLQFCSLTCTMFIKMLLFDTKASTLQDVCVCVSVHNHTHTYKHNTYTNTHITHTFLTLDINRRGLTLFLSYISSASRLDPSLAFVLLITDIFWFSFLSVFMWI